MTSLRIAVVLISLLFLPGVVFLQVSGGGGGGGTFTDDFNRANSETISSTITYSEYEAAANCDVEIDTNTLEFVSEDSGTGCDNVVWRALARRIWVALTTASSLNCRAAARTQDHGRPGEALG